VPRKRKKIPLSGNPDELLLAEDLEALYKYPTSTQKCDRCLGKGPIYFRIGRKILYKKSDVEAWLNKHRVDRGA
jgi:hypothetical protein